MAHIIKQMDMVSSTSNYNSYFNASDHSNKTDVSAGSLFGAQAREAAFDSVDNEESDLVNPT